MHVFKGTLLVVAAIVVLASAAAAQVNTAYAPMDNLRDWLHSGFVSFPRLLCRLEEFNGQRIRVQGVLHYTFEDNALYASMEAADYLIGEQALWVSFADTVRQHWNGRGKRVILSREEIESQHGRYVLIEGTVNIHRHGHLGGFVATLDSVTAVVSMRRWSDGPTSLYKDK